MQTKSIKIKTDGFRMWRFGTDDEHEFIRIGSIRSGIFKSLF
jgi:hypothetical protein